MSNVKQAYVQTQLATIALLEQLTTETVKSAEDISWDNVGTWNEVNRKLGEILEFVTSK
jgi:hypothetical protein